MVHGSSFDKLVTELSSGERRDLLLKLQSTVSVSDEPLNDEEVDEGEEVRLEEAYYSMGLWQRFVVLLTALFTGKERLEIVEERLIRNLGQNLEQEAPDIIDASGVRLRPGFFRAVDTLQRQLACFQNPLGVALGRARGEFYAFLVGTVMEAVHDRLLQETDPEPLALDSPQASERELRHRIDKRFEEILGEIDERERQAIYAEIRSLYQLEVLAGIPYDTVLAAGGEDMGMDTDLMREFRSVLGELADVLYSLRTPPSVHALEAVFLFSVDSSVEPAELPNVLRERLRRAEDGLAAIREFNRFVPLLRVLKFLYRDMNYVPTELGGGEDWFVMYRDYWKSRITRRFNAFSQERNKKRLMEDIYAFLGQDHLPRLKRYRSNAWMGGVPARYEISLAFIKAFHDQVLMPEMNRYLKTLLIDGEFYKQENREEYTDSYNGLLRIPEGLDAIEERLSEDGEIGGAIRQTLNEPMSQSVRRQRVRNLLQQADREAESFILRTEQHLHLCKEVVNGILYGEVGGKYDTLSNIGYIGGKNNQGYLRELNEVMKKAERGESYLRQMYELERRWGAGQDSG